MVEGLCKLLLNDRISSSKLLTRLILLWYKPTTGELETTVHFILQLAQASSKQFMTLSKAWIIRC